MHMHVTMPQCDRWGFNEAVGIEQFMHSLGMGIFEHAGCSSSNKE